MTQHARPIWDHGGVVDPEMLAFTIGDDWRQDQRLVEVDIRGSLAHAAGLLRAGYLAPGDHDAIRLGLETLLATWRAGEWNVGPEDEDVHSAVERRLIDAIGEAGKRLHLGRSRNDQVATDLRLWLREAIAATGTALAGLVEACDELEQRHGDLPLPGYTHLRRAMPSSIADWIGAYRAAFELDGRALEHAALRLATCPLGSGAGYGVPLDLDRAGVAADLGFEAPEDPVTLPQLTRGRPELDYVTALEGISLDLGKLAADLWLFTTGEFGFAHLPESLTTGSSLMPHKRNPDLIELLRAQSRQVQADRAALLEVLRDLPSGYHRDFQLAKPPLFRAHDRLTGALPLMAKVIAQLELNEEALRQAAADPDLEVTGRALERAAQGEAFRDVYREASSSPTEPRPPHP